MRHKFLTQGFFSTLKDVPTFFVSHYKKTNSLPLVSPNLKLLNEEFCKQSLSEKGVDELVVLQEFKKRIMPGMFNINGRAFPWVIGKATPAAQLGAMLGLCWDDIVMTHGHSISSKVEEVTLNMLLDLVKLPRNQFSATFTTGATASNFIALAAARQWVGKQYGKDISELGISDVPIEIYMGDVHSSIFKALGFLGIGRSNVFRIRSQSQREAMDLSDLELQLKTSQRKVKIVVAGLGYVNTGDSDNLLQVADLCEKYNAWLHVDGAFGLFIRLHEDHRYAKIAAGIERATSISADGHKWLNMPKGCGILFLNKSKAHLLEETCNASAVYLGGNSDEVHPMNKGIENTRPFNALPVWFALKTYGREGFKNIVEHNCEFALALGQWIEASSDFELLTPIKMNIICFRAKNANNTLLLKEINSIGKVFLTATRYHGQDAIRIAVSNWQTTLIDDLSLTIAALEEGIENYKKNNFDHATIRSFRN